MRRNKMMLQIISGLMMIILTPGIDFNNTYKCVPIQWIIRIRTEYS